MTPQKETSYHIFKMVIFSNNTELFTNRFFIHFYDIFNCPVFTVIWSLKYQSCVLFYLSVYLAESSLSIEKPKSPKDYLEIYPRAISVGYRWSTCVLVCFTGCWIMWFISSWEIFHCCYKLCKFKKWKLFSLKWVVFSWNL